METKEHFFKILIISSCAGEKRYSPANKATAIDLEDFHFRQIKEKELEKYKLPAKEMFISSHNIKILEGIALLQNINNFKIDLSFISSGYGFIDSEDFVIPYEVNLSVMTKTELDKRADLFKIHEEAYYKAKNYDLVFFLLGYDYLRMLKLPLNLSDNVKQIFFTSSHNEKLIPKNENIFVFVMGNEEYSNIKIQSNELKGFMFKLLCNNAIQNNQIFFEIYKNPNLINDILKTEIQKLNKDDDFEQLKLFDF